MPNLVRSHLIKATNEMKLEDELRQYIQGALDIIIENSFPDILRDASEGFRAQEIADRNQSVAPVQGALPLPNLSSHQPSSSTHSPDTWHPVKSPDFEHTSYASAAGSDTLPSPASSSRNEMRGMEHIGSHEEHYLHPSSMTHNPYSSFDVGGQKMEPVEPSALQEPLDIQPQMQMPEDGMFDSQTGWQTTESDDTTYDWQGVGFGTDSDFQIDNSLVDGWD